MAKDDYIEITAIVGGHDLAYRVVAGKQGRTVDGEWSKDGNLQWYVAQEKTRGGTVTKQVAFAATSIVAITIVKKEV